MRQLFLRKRGERSLVCRLGADDARDVGPAPGRV